MMKWAKRKLSNRKQIVNAFLLLAYLNLFIFNPIAALITGLFILFALGISMLFIRLVLGN